MVVTVTVQSVVMSYMSRCINGKMGWSVIRVTVIKVIYIDTADRAVIVDVRGPFRDSAPVKGTVRMTMIRGRPPVAMHHSAA